jgi:hypothetical protein
MRTKTLLLAEALIESKFNPLLVIPMVEVAIEMEQRSCEANQILNDEPAYLKNERTIAQGEILLSILRLNSGSSPHS